jgi:CheY-specific phosphatase CheX
MNLPTQKLDEIAQQSLQEVFRKQFRMKVIPADSGHRTTLGDPILKSEVGWSSANLRGVVQIHLPQDLVREISLVLLGDGPDASPVDLKDVAGEIGNMVAGRVSALLAQEGLHGTLETPQVRAVNQEETEKEKSEFTPQQHGEWICGTQRFSLSLQFHPSGS